MRTLLSGFGSAVLLCSTATQAQVSPQGAIALDAGAKLEPRNARLEWVEHRGRMALHVAPLAGHEQDVDQEMSAVLVDSDFEDGVIEVDVAGARRAGYAKDDASAFKGFIGVSFRVSDDGAERFYLRTENARLDDQLFRNRSTQYEADPDLPWNRLRAEAPGKYESYVDLEPGAWTRMRIEVSGRIALWTRISCDAYFSDLRIRSNESAPLEPAPLAPTYATTDAPIAAPRGDAQPAAGPRVEIQPDAARFLGVVNGETRLVQHRGRAALELVPAPETAGKDEDVLAILDAPAFEDGVIEVDVAGEPRPGAPSDSRGFVGVAFRTGEDGERSEVFYLRPTNARCDDQLRRNHSVQYVSHPDWPWHRLREEQPGRYESYADLEPGAWTSLKVVVEGRTARLFVNGAAQPCLVVTDLKHGDGPGRVALWAHVDTAARFGTIALTPR